MSDWYTLTFTSSWPSSSVVMTFGRALAKVLNAARYMLILHNDGNNADKKGFALLPEGRFFNRNVAALTLPSLAPRASSPSQLWSQQNSQIFPQTTICLGNEGLGSGNLTSTSSSHSRGWH